MSKSTDLCFDDAFVSPQVKRLLNTASSICYGSPGSSYSERWYFIRGCLSQLIKTDSFTASDVFCILDFLEGNLRPDFVQDVQLPSD